MMLKLRKAAKNISKYFDDLFLLSVGGVIGYFAAEPYKFMVLAITFFLTVVLLVIFADEGEWFHETPQPENEKY